MTMLTLPINLSSEDFEDICDTAGYAIGYWAHSAVLGQDYYRVNDDDGDHEITRSHMIHTVAEIIAGKYDLADSIRRNIILAFVNDDLGELDAYDMDAIIQLACFKEIVYG